MKKQTISIIAILAVGSFFSVAYSASTIISDAGNFNKASISMSADGKYISVSGLDSTSAIQKLLIFGGS